MRIKHHRTAAGMSQTQLAVAIERAARRRSAVARQKITVPSRDTLKTQISFWENGHREPAAFYQLLLSDALNVPDSDLFDRSPAPVNPVDEASAELQLRLLTAAAVDPTTVELLNSQTHQLRLIDRRLGGREVLGQLRNHIGTVEGLLTHAVLPNQRRPLAAVLADAAALAGWQALDTGIPAEAWKHCETAKSAAREAESPALLAHAMGEQAYALLDLGRPDDALALVRAAQGLSAFLPPLLICWLAAAAAELCAANRYADECYRVLDLADRLLPGDCADPELPYLLLTPAHLARWRGSALARLGNPGAISHLYAALGGMGVTSTLRAEAGIRVDLVAALITSGNHDQATAEALAARQLAPVIHE
jgi:transcriptional regulator with XRE-family HTH domain